MYLRPTGDKATMAAALAQRQPEEEELEEFIEIALHEGVAPALGYRLVLERFGTCNAITTFENAIMQRPRADQQAAAAMLVRQLHDDLLHSLRTEIGREEGQPPPERSLAGLVADRDWLFIDNNYHIDTTHLAAVVRFARFVEDTEVVRLALDLTAYGRRLSRQFQFAGEEPFVDVYPTSGLFFAAQLGQQVDDALAHFRARAEAVNIEEQGTAAAETYVALLARLKRFADAIAAAATLLPAGVRTTGFAPSLLELSRLAGSYERLMAACKERGDLVGYTAGLLEQKAGHRG